MFKILIISIIIIIVILILFVAAISKGYSYKHTIDPIDNNQNIKKDREENKLN